MDKKQSRLESPGSVNGESVWVRNPASQREADAAVLDHRTSLRKDIHYRALLNFGLTYSKIWALRDMSLNGAFVEMDAAELREGELVEFVLRYDYKDVPHEHRLPALVHRIDPDGVALRFGRYDDQTYTQLVNLLYAM